MEYNLRKFWIPMLYTENKPPHLKSHQQTRSWSHWPLPWRVLDKSCFLPHFRLSKFFHHSCCLPHGLVFKQEVPLSLLSAFCDSSANTWQSAYWLRTIQDSRSGVLLCGNGSPLGRDSNLLSPSGHVLEMVFPPLQCCRWCEVPEDWGSHLLAQADLQSGPTPTDCPCQVECPCSPALA